MMPLTLTTPEDYQTLASHSWITFWAAHRFALVELGGRHYRTLLFHAEKPWERAEIFAQRFTTTLTGTLLFRQKCDELYHRRWITTNQALKIRFAQALARYIIDMDWSIIAFPPPGERP